MPKSKKVNPNRRPATQADVKKAAKSGVEGSVSTTQGIFFSVLRDKEGFDKERLQDFWANVRKLSDEIVEGRVSVADLRLVLREEDDIFV